MGSITGGAIDVSFNVIIVSSAHSNIVITVNNRIVKNIDSCTS